ncbi:hypothetical protein M406DRAFT_74957 [Cryphonectria parasitica EP155]|uniref:Uncharacterized protein n=1 Tax=Cryphonectria parasitica (strain ATCC 38755 / EP155) TaxID=660469 RepID=A0A9P4XWG6_CRYP1|nr:uncharacterized protein M406DRAFT_74957 [Cryphonectria parasitica EP155]KAF3762040.1 hypothetical protein M406DRAFT_74957 [Cryphonectria parasitica EP155]
MHFANVPALLSVLLASKAAATSTANTTRTVYEFPPGTWVENIAVRSNGNLLLMPEQPYACLYSLDPSAASPEPVLIQNLTETYGYSSLFGIAESLETPDLFYFIAGNFTYSEGENAIFTVTFSNTSDPEVTLFSKIEGAVFLNGLSAHPLNTSLIIAGDSSLGQTWSINTQTGTYAPGIQNKTLMSMETGSLAGGINGLKVGDAGKTLYFTNTAQNIMGKIAIDAAGNAADNGAADAVLAVANLPGQGWDDLAVYPPYYDSAAFLAAETSTYLYAATSAAYAIERIDPATSTGVYIAGSVNSTQIERPTACQLGRGEADAGWLYVTTAGDTGETDESLGGQIVAVYVGN